MNEQRFQDCLYILLETIAVSNPIDEEEEDLWPAIGEGDFIKSVRSFADVGMLTKNLGLVVKLEDGSEFQLTIVKSK